MSKEKAKRNSTKRAVRGNKYDVNSTPDERGNNKYDATRESMRAGRRNYGQGVGK